MRIRYYLLLVLMLVLTFLIVPKTVVRAAGDTDGECFCKIPSLINGYNSTALTLQKNKAADTKALCASYKKRVILPARNGAALSQKCVMSESRYTDCKYAEYSPTEGGFCTCNDEKATCQWYPNFCCCHKTDTSQDCVKSSVYKGDTSVCNSDTFSDPTDRTAVEDKCWCYYEQLADTMHESFPGQDQNFCNTFNGHRKNNGYNDVPPGKMSGNVILSGCVYAALIDNAGNESNRVCVCTASHDIRPPAEITVAQTRDQCTPAFAKSKGDTNVYTRCEWRGGTLTQEGYIVQPVKSDGSCSYPLPDSQFTVKVSDLQEKAKGLNQLTAFKGPTDLIAQGIKVLLSFIGSLSLIFYIYAGLMWMTAAGNTERAGKAKQIIVWTTLGLIAMLSSYMLVKFIFGAVLQLPGVKSNV